MSEEKKTVTETINMTEESREELRKTLTQTERPDTVQNVSGDVDVTGILDEYTDLSDTMVTRKTVTMNEVPSGTIQMDPPKAETARMTKTQIPSETIQMDSPAPSSETAGEQSEDQKAGEEQKKAAEEQEKAAEEQPLDPETEAIKRKIIERKRKRSARRETAGSDSGPFLSFWLQLSALLSSPYPVFSLSIQ